MKGSTCNTVNEKFWIRQKDIGSWDFTSLTVQQYNHIPEWRYGAQLDHARAKCTQVIIQNRKRENCWEKRKGQSYLLRENSVQSTDKDRKDAGRYYLHPAMLRRWAYILPMSPMPMIPIMASSLVKPILNWQHQVQLTMIWSTQIIFQPEQLTQHQIVALVAVLPKNRSACEEEKNESCQQERREFMRKSTASSARLFAETSPPLLRTVK